MILSSMRVLFVSGLTLAACGSTVVPETSLADAAVGRSDGSVASTDGAPAGSDASTPPIVVGACSGLAAAGQWEEISPPGLTKKPPYTGALVTLMHPTNAGTLYVTTSMNGIYKSTDCGATWTKINTGRNGAMLDMGDIWSAQIDPVDPDTIYALTGYGPSGVWKSTNGGVDWDNILPTTLGMPGFVANIALDPTDPQHVLLNFHDNCSGGHTPVCFGESKDGGATWTVLDFPTSLANMWGEAWQLSPVDATHWVLQASILYYSADAGKTWTLVDTAGAGNIEGPYYKAANGALYLSSTQGVITSTDNGAHWMRIQNSGNTLHGIVGCGASFYGVVGFQAPTDNNFVYTAPLTDPQTWSLSKAPGLPQPMVSGANTISCDASHGIVYVAAQGAGLWRMATGVSQ